VFGDKQPALHNDGRPEPIRHPGDVGALFGRTASASLIETCKLNDVDSLAYMTDVLARIDPNSEPAASSGRMIGITREAAKLITLSDAIRFPSGNRVITGAKT
jgi:hypothetical protein